VFFIDQVMEPESFYLADSELDPALAPLHAAASTYRIALGPRAGQKVLTWKDPALALPSQKVQHPPPGCVSAHGFSLHANVHCGPHQLSTLERLCRNRMLKKPVSGVLGRESVLTY
jgi:hypothetical protein